MIRGKPSVKEHDFITWECANCIQELENPTCWPIVQITGSMSVAQGGFIAGRNVSLVIITMKLLLQFSKFLRIELFKAKAPSPTWEIFNCISGMKKFNQCLHLYFQFKANHDRAGGMWNGRMGEKVFFCGLCMSCRVWYFVLWDLGRWGRDRDWSIPVFGGGKLCRYRRDKRMILFWFCVCNWEKCRWEKQDDVWVWKVTDLDG